MRRVLSLFSPPSPCAPSSPLLSGVTKSCEASPEIVFLLVAMLVHQLVVRSPEEIVFRYLPRFDEVGRSEFGAGEVPLRVQRAKVFSHCGDGNIE